MDVLATARADFYFTGIKPVNVKLFLLFFTSASPSLTFPIILPIISPFCLKSPNSAYILTSLA